MPAKITKDIFIKMNKQRNEKFSDCKVYFDNPEAVETKKPFNCHCDLGHEWTVTAYSRHMKGQGCPKCIEIKHKKVIRNKALEQLISLYSGKYSYPNFDKEYIDSTSKITIICSDHGEYTKSYSRHYGGDDCSLCKRLITQDEYRISDEYMKLFETMKLRLTNLNSNSNMHQDIECLICGNVFNATPKSKVSNYRFWGSIGCPKCTETERYKDIKNEGLYKLINSNYELHTPYVGVKTKILVHNKTCSCKRQWWTQPANLFIHENMCKPCNNERKREFMLELCRINSENALKNKEGFEKYESQVNLLSNHNYRKHIDALSNHGEKIRGRGLYHLDHIIPITYCFVNNIPYELCGHIDNLRMIPEKENLIKYNKITTKFPKIFEKYTKIIDDSDDEDSENELITES